MARKRKPAIELLSDIGKATFDLQTYSDAEVADAMTFMRNVNGPLVEYLVARLMSGGGRLPVDEGPQTCATCQWWEPHFNASGASMQDGRCFKGVRVGSPTRQAIDGGLYTAPTFGCILHQPREKDQP